MPIKDSQGKGFEGSAKPTAQPQAQQQVSTSAFDVVAQGNHALRQVSGLLTNNGDVLVGKVETLADQHAQSVGQRIAMAAHPDVVDARSMVYAVNFLSSCERSAVDTGLMARSQGLPSVQSLQLASLSGLYAHRPQNSKQLQSSSGQ